MGSTAVIVLFIEHSGSKVYDAVFFYSIDELKTVLTRTVVFPQNSPYKGDPGNNRLPSGLVSLVTSIQPVIRVLRSLLWFAMVTLRTSCLLSRKHSLALLYHFLFSYMFLISFPPMHLFWNSLYLSLQFLLQWNSYYTILTHCICKHLIMQMIIRLFLHLLL